MEALRTFVIVTATHGSAAILRLNAGSFAGAILVLLEFLYEGGMRSAPGTIQVMGPHAGHGPVVEHEHGHGHEHEARDKPA